MKILLTGGAGYIGSHTAVELISEGHDVVIVDDFSNSKEVVINRISEITGTQISYHRLDIRDTETLVGICRDEAIEAAIHFAGLKAVGESVEDPLRYYDVNLGSSVSLCKAMVSLNIRHLVFSSSATVYGEPERIPLDEECRASDAANPYGRTKIIIEQILKDMQLANPDMNIALLRYFNPAGAHLSGKLGEDPTGIPNNLVPFLTQVAIGKRSELVINGDDYPTPDGTCIRDYIHVQDLARGHVAALAKLRSDCGVVTYNLGTGQGQSVKEVVSAFERSTNQHLNRRIGPRRPGDVPVSYTDPSLAERELNWKATLTIEDICRDAWHWQQENPGGY
ncbi:MAG: UDP-glucose 4-epimerase GalE [Gammaproteobacteria bacterium]|jgi:UDP-glucose 4-epimerase|nr:UDP-glucose 4-epimerase GalE [Gammaproteobacteria bacterium]MBT7370394.1 UDP-glucose 4-epimerase GalE [Gammaproteobacteria bacterium]